jgi:hypothetical protein
MKKLVYVFAGLLMMASCSKSEKSPFNYRGLALSLPASQMVEQLQERGFVVDSAASDSGHTVVMAKDGEHYRVLIGIDRDKVLAVQENYKLSTNDSTRRLWQEIHDNLEKELGAWPDCPMLKDDHKVANFDASDGIISVVLENTYKPTLMVRYTPKKK